MRSQAIAAGGIASTRQTSGQARPEPTSDEDSCLTLVWAVLDLLITHETNGIRFNELERQRLKRIRYEGHEQPATD